MRRIVGAVMGLVGLSLGPALPGLAVTTREYSVQLDAEVQSAPAQIDLRWLPDSASTAAKYTVYRRSPGAVSWGAGAPLPGTATSYVDRNVSVGMPYEYQIVKQSIACTGYGYIYAGINVPAHRRPRQVAAGRGQHLRRRVFRANSRGFSRTSSATAGRSSCLDVNRTDSVEPRQERHSSPNTPPTRRTSKPSSFSATCRFPTPATSSPTAITPITRAPGPATATMATWTAPGPTRRQRHQRADSRAIITCPGTASSINRTFPAPTQADGRPRGFGQHAGRA